MKEAAVSAKGEASATEEEEAADEAAEVTEDVAAVEVEEAAAEVVDSELHGKEQSRILPDRKKHLTTRTKNPI